MDDVYIKPWCRIAPYAIGLALGYCLYENYQRKNSISWESLLPETAPSRSQRIKQIVIWSFALTIIGLCIFGTFRDYDGHSLTKAGRAAFLSLSRVGWAIAISLIITSCCSGEGGLLLRCTSGLCIRLSRLSFFRSCQSISESSSIWLFGRVDLRCLFMALTRDCRQLFRSWRANSLYTA